MVDKLVQDYPKLPSVLSGCTVAASDSIMAKAIFLWQSKQLKTLTLKSLKLRLVPNKKCIMPTSSP